MVEKRRLARVAEILSYRLEDYGLRRSEIKLKEDGPREDEWVGWWSPVATWGLGRPAIAAYLGQYFESGLSEFWFGFQSARQDEIRKLFVEQPKSSWLELKLTDTRDRVRNTDQLIYEKTSEERSGNWAYFGKYFIVEDSSNKMLVENAVDFIIKIVERIDPFLAEQRDIKELDRKCTEYKALVLARRGQGKFRLGVEERWGNKCAVYGYKTREVLRASHIKPWREATNKERLSADNGLLLSATLDALFDKWLISFEDDGSIIISERLNKEDRKSLKLDGLVLCVSRPLNNRQKENLHLHREKLYQTAHKVA